MNIAKMTAAALLAGVCAFGLGFAGSETQAQTAGTRNAGTSTVPIDVWALRNVVNAVEVSPDGKHILVHKTETREGEYILEIYKTDDLSKPFRRLNADPMEITGATWVSDDVIFGSAWQQVRKAVREQEDETYNRASYFYSLEDNKFQQVRGTFRLVNDLPDEPDEILIGTGKDVTDNTGIDPFAAFRPISYYKLNLKRGTRKLVIQGNTKYSNILFDNQGNPRYAEGVDDDFTIKTYYRLPGDGSWKQFGPTYDQNDHNNLYRFLGGVHGVKAFDPENPNIGYLVDNPDGGDKAALFKFDFAQGKIIEEMFRPELADVMGVQRHSIPGNDTVVAAWYPGAKIERQWFDEEEQALHEALERQLPNGHFVRITSRSRDGQTMIVNNIGPKDPGSFWLVKDGQVAKLGSRNPLLSPEQLSDVEFITYKARDGMTIPAYVTKPKGEGPFPLIVMPHGGPHVNEVVLFDEWGQMLANAGYMVLQPQYRMSTGWGQKLFDGGYGEHGGKMQDDKDDGARYLIEQGMVDPDRVAMFGWSYGGYAALVALSREEQLYQCAIAGAAVADPAKTFREGAGRAGSRAPKALIDWAERRGTIGVNPIKEVSKVNIPLLMIHPEVDSRVLYYHFVDYKKEFEKTDKNGQFVTLEGADHFSVTLMYEHQQQLYTKMLDYLANDCGPGGL